MEGHTGVRRDFGPWMLVLLPAVATALIQATEPFANMKVRDLHLHSGMAYLVRQGLSGAWAVVLIAPLLNPQRQRWAAIWATLVAGLAVLGAGLTSSAILLAALRTTSGVAGALIIALAYGTIADRISTRRQAGALFVLRLAQVGVALAGSSLLVFLFAVSWNPNDVRSASSILASAAQNGLLTLGGAILLISAATWLVTRLDAEISQDQGPRWFGDSGLVQGWKTWLPLIAAAILAAAAQGINSGNWPVDVKGPGRAYQAAVVYGLSGAIAQMAAVPVGGLIAYFSVRRNLSPLWPASWLFGVTALFALAAIFSSTASSAVFVGVGREFCLAAATFCVLVTILSKATPGFGLQILALFIYLQSTVEGALTWIVQDWIAPVLSNSAISARISALELSLGLLLLAAVLSVVATGTFGGGSPAESERRAWTGEPGVRIGRRGYLVWIAPLLALTGLLVATLWPHPVMVWVVQTALNISPLVALAIFLSWWRLHDLDRSGWLALLILVPGLNLLLVAALACKKGTVGPNRFGPAPVASEA